MQTLGKPSASRRMPPPTQLSSGGMMSNSSNAASVSSNLKLASAVSPPPQSQHHQQQHTTINSDPSLNLPSRPSSAYDYMNNPNGGVTIAAVVSGHHQYSDSDMTRWTASTGAATSASSTLLSSGTLNQSDFPKLDEAVQQQQQQQMGSMQQPPRPKSESNTSTSTPPPQHQHQYQEDLLLSSRDGGPVLKPSNVGNWGNRVAPNNDNYDYSANSAHAHKSQPANAASQLQPFKPGQNFRPQSNR